VRPGPAVTSLAAAAASLGVASLRRQPTTVVAPDSAGPGLQRRMLVEDSCHFAVEQLDVAVDRMTIERRFRT